MTVAESEPNPGPNIHRSEYAARMHHSSDAGGESHLEIRRSVYLGRDHEQSQHVHQEKKPNEYPEECRRAMADDKFTDHRALHKCTYNCTNYEDAQCAWNSTREMMRRFREYDLGQTTAITTTKADP
jgi:hypothetical protein